MNGPNRLFESESDHLRPPSSARRRDWRHEWSAGLLGVLLLTQLVSLALAEEVYTWKDEAGRVHFGNRPPEGQAAESVQLNTKPVSVQPTEHIYTWTDAEGKIHYGARPPPGVSAKELKEDDASLSTIRSGQLRAGEKRLLQELQRRQ